MFKQIIVSTFCFFALVACANARLIDDFEEGAFLIAFELGPNLSVHQTVDARHVIGGDRDSGTSAFDGPGGGASLTLTPKDDGVVITCNPTGIFYESMFQYDGLGRNAFNLNTDLTSEGHDAFLIHIPEVSLSRAASIQMTLASNWQGLTGIVANVTLPIEHAGVMRFSYAAFTADNPKIDFTDVDYIAVMAKLQTSSSITISEIRTGMIVPEPSTAILAALLLASMLCYHHPRCV